MRGLNSRFTKYALLLFSHKEIFKAREDGQQGKHLITKHNDTYPIVYQFSADVKIPMNNGNSNLVIVTGNELDKLAEN